MHVYFCRSGSLFSVFTLTQHCISPGSLNRVPALIGWGKGGDVTSAGWQVTLCDPICGTVVGVSVVECGLNCYRRLSLPLPISAGGLQSFYACYSSLCSSPDVPPSRPFLFSPTTPVVELDVDTAEMSQILPFLFLGPYSSATSSYLYSYLCSFRRPV